MTTKTESNAIELAKAAIKTLLAERSRAAAHMLKIEEKAAALQQPDPELDQLKSRKSELYGMREDIMAAGLLGEKNRGGLTLQEVNTEIQDIDKKMRMALEQTNERLALTAGLERRRVDASTALQNVDRQLREAVKAYLEARMENAVGQYEQAAAIVKDVYPLLRGCGTWLASLNDGCRWPFLDDVSQRVGGNNAVLPFGVPVETLQRVGVQSVLCELNALLPADCMPAAPRI